MLLVKLTGGTFIQRQIDNRGLDERIYKMRYVVPKEFKTVVNHLKVSFFKNPRVLVLVLHPS